MRSETCALISSRAGGQDRPIHFDFVLTITNPSLTKLVGVVSNGPSDCDFSLFYSILGGGVIFPA